MVTRLEPNLLRCDVSLCVPVCLHLVIEEKIHVIFMLCGKKFRFIVTLIDHAYSLSQRRFFTALKKKETRILKLLFISFSRPSRAV